MPRVDLIELTPGHALRRAVVDLLPLPEQEQYSGHAEETLREADDDPARTAFAIVEDGRAVGFGVLDRGPLVAELTVRPRRTVLLRAFYVDAADQGRGLGQAAVALLPSFAARMAPDATTMVLTINVANPVAARTYVGGGFTDTGRRYDGGQHGPQYVLELDLVRARRAHRLTRLSRRPASRAGHR